MHSVLLMGTHKTLFKKILKLITTSNRNKNKKKAEKEEKAKEENFYSLVKITSPSQQRSIRCLIVLKEYFE